MGAVFQNSFFKKKVGNSALPLKNKKQKKVGNGSLGAPE